MGGIDSLPFTGFFWRGEGQAKVTSGRKDDPFSTIISLVLKLVLRSQSILLNGRLNHGSFRVV